MISEDFTMDILTGIHALARIVRIVTLSAIRLANRILLMRDRKWRPGARSKRDGKEKNRCGGMSKPEEEERSLHGDTRIGND